MSDDRDRRTDDEGPDGDLDDPGAERRIERWRTQGPQT